MFKCDDCGAIFSETGVKTESEQYEYWGAKFTHKHHYECCPICAGEEFKSYQEEEECKQIID